MIRHRIIGLISCLLVFTAADAARAGTLVAPALTYGSERVACSIVNGGAKDIGPVTVTIRRFDGTVADETTIETIEPNSTSILLATPAEVGIASSVTCIVSGKGVSKKTPVSLCLVDAVSPFTCLVVSQAP